MNLTDPVAFGVIPDSSVWIEFERRKTAVAEVVAALAESRRLLLAGPVLAEVLVGSPYPDEYDMRMSPIKFLPTTRRIWITGARLRRESLGRGQSVPMMDCIIAAHAIEENAAVYTLDRDFSRIPGVKLYEPQ